MILIAACISIVARTSLAVETLTDDSVIPDFGEAEAVHVANEPLRIPEVALADLSKQVPSAIVVARTALSELGALVVVGGKDSSKALEAWAQCLQVGGSVRKEGMASQRSLAGGFVRRTSVFAKDRWGVGSLSAVFPSCPGAAEHESAMRLSVRKATQALGAALENKPRVTTDDVSLNDAIREGEHLEHLHLYEEARNRGKQSDKHQALDMHTDAGALLAFVPPISVGTAESPFLEVEDADGKRHALAAFPKNSVVFFMGQSSRLLSQRASLRPLPHALSLPLGFSWRAWYGVMILLPHDAVVHPDPASPKSGIPFGSMWEAARSQVSNKHASTIEDAAPIGCGPGLVLADQGGTCPKGTIACWMQCMSIEALGTCNGHHWIASGRGDIVEWVNVVPQCREPSTGKKYPEETGKMCNSCKPVCTSGGNTTAPDVAPDQGFCSSLGGGTVMYMDGFKWTANAPDAACLNLFFESWSIDSPGKLVLACVIVALLGVTMEMVSLVRRQLPFKRQRDIGYGFHGVNLCLAYLVMLVIMMYSLELFLSSLLGLVIGHILSTIITRRIVTKGLWRHRQPEGQNDCACPSEVVPDHGAHSMCCRLSLGLDAPLMTQSREGSMISSHALVQTVDAESETLLDIRGMTCGTCSAAVKKALLSVNGVVKAEVSLLTNQARVSYNDPADVALICEAVESVGFDAAERKTNV